MTESKTRRYPRRRLKGTITVHYSMRPKFPKYHIVDECEGYEKVVEEARATTVFAGALELATVTSGRPCRMCTLESVIITCGDPVRRPPRDTFITFTSQASPLNGDSNVWAYNWQAATDSGIARLRRLAKRLDLEVTGTASGPAAFGMVTKEAAVAISSNLRAVVRPELSESVGFEVVGTLWTLLNDDPPETHTEDDPFDAWTAALLLSN